MILCDKFLIRLGNWYYNNLLLIIFFNDSTGMVIKIISALSIKMIFTHKRRTVKELMYKPKETK